MKLSRQFDIIDHHGKAKHIGLKEILVALDGVLVGARIYGDAELTIIDKNPKKGSKDPSRITVPAHSLGYSPGKPIVTAGPYVCLVKTASHSPHEVQEALRKLLVAQAAPAVENASFKDWKAGEPRATTPASPAVPYGEGRCADPSDPKDLQRGLLRIFSFRTHNGSIHRGKAINTLREEGIFGPTGLERALAEKIVKALEEARLLIRKRGYPEEGEGTCLGFSKKAGLEEWLDVGADHPDLLDDPLAKTQTPKPTPSEPQTTKTMPTNEQTPAPAQPKEFSARAVMELLTSGETGSGKRYPKEDVREAIKLTCSASGRSIAAYFTALTRGGFLVRNGDGSYSKGKGQRIGPMSHPAPSPSSGAYVLKHQKTDVPRDLAGNNGGTNAGTALQNLGPVPSDLNLLANYIKEAEKAVIRLEIELATTKKNLSKAQRLESVWKGEA
jgi:hypothetical protein